jgi:hypothetical protein
VRVRAEPFPGLNNVVIQNAENSETDVVGIAIFGKGKMKMAVQPAVPSPPHLFTVNVLSHKNLLIYIVTILIPDFKPPVNYPAKILHFSFSGQKRRPNNLLKTNTSTPQASKPAPQAASG